MAKAIFDADVANEAHGVGEAMEVAMASFLVRLFKMFPLPRWVPTPDNLRRGALSGDWTRSSTVSSSSAAPAPTGATCSRACCRCATRTAAE